MDNSDNYGRYKTSKRIIVGIGLVGSLIFGISSCNFSDLSGLISLNTATELPSAPVVTPTPRPSATPNIPVLQSRTMIIWAPPQFDPNNGTTAGNLFLSHLDEFLTRRPQTDIQVRVKPLTGEYGLLESLSLTRSAAPIILPDLIALPRPVMEQAFKEGLILPLDGYTETISENDWYSYALDAAHVKEELAGIPFAGDLMVLAYKNDAGEAAPPDWDSVLNAQKTLAFPASDPQGVVTLAYYQSLNGSLYDQAGGFTLEEEPLLDILTYYQHAQAANVMPYWLTQFENDQQSWQSYQDRQSTMAITWSSIYLGSEAPNTSLAAIPTKEGKAFSYANAWVWCVVPSDLETEQIAVELAEYLTTESYLSPWTVEGGYLPVRPSGLARWSEVPFYSTLQQLLPSATLLPGNDLLVRIGPSVRDAVVAVLKDQTEPAAALEVLLGAVSTP